MNSKNEFMRINTNQRENFINIKLIINFSLTSKKAQKFFIDSLYENYGFKIYYVPKLIYEEK